jgi:hypothetical protein
MPKFKTVAAALAVLTIGAGIAWASGDWSGAQSKVAELKNQEAELAKLAPQQGRAIVHAICEAAEDDRQSAANSASSDAASRINDKYRDAERTYDDAKRMLEAVESDDNLRDHHSDASSMRSDMEREWDHVKDLTHSLRDQRYEAVSFMLEHGRSARQDHLSYCDAKDVSLDAGHAACLMAQGETCEVVETAPDNSNGISHGRDKARRYADQLTRELGNKDSYVWRDLVSHDSKFGQCKRFEARVDCYKLCPDISDDNRVNERSVDWRRSCS